MIRVIGSPYSIERARTIAFEFAFAEVVSNKRAEAAGVEVGRDVNPVFGRISITGQAGGRLLGNLSALVLI